jgi:ABC-type hemin transport system ATPase subunit
MSNGLAFAYTNIQMVYANTIFTAALMKTGCENFHQRFVLQTSSGNHYRLHHRCISRTLFESRHV